MGEAKRRTLATQYGTSSVTKTIEQNFIDWENHVFGLGYGTGERHTLGALKTFLEHVGLDDGERSYAYEELETVLTPTVAWLLINTLCRAEIIEYGTSPRYGWLTPEGEALKAFVASKNVDELVELCANCPSIPDYIPCTPDACNCGPDGYQKGVKCRNPFWPGHH